MPILPEIEELLKDYDPADQKVMRENYEKNPGLQAKVKEQLMGTRDYHRKIQVVSDKEKAADTRKTEADNLYKKNMDWFNSTEADVLKLEEENKTLKSDIEKAKAAKATAGSDGTTPVEMEKINKTIEGLQTQLEKTSKALQESETKVAQRFDQGGMFLVEIEDIADQYTRTFGEPFVRKDFIKYMNDNKLSDPQAAYKDFTKDKSDAKWKSETETELRKKIEEENKVKGVPYDTAGSLHEKGALQHYIERTDAAPKTTTEAASRAASELRSEGKV